MIEFCTAWAQAVGSGTPPAHPYAIRNDYYGGDVNVTGLIVSCDLLAQLPEVMFNFDHVTLDGDTQEHILEEIRRRGGEVLVTMPGAPHNIDALLGYYGEA